ncbi:flagellar hook-length control protein FliK [Sphingopyxis sp. USTB-05]|uniref:flagellar hook-length control protein FliK n=2 Tax=unclassified Sphingopyxis TaxID=2614943 RepID=UPI0009FB6AFE|nr:flagellar hook-length control protein FliK [Sphingopyxis sp. USTB-05]USI76941.1 flagellar hook-length control protein FliK [Sphingopyxis sp. USTB-05]
MMSASSLPTPQGAMPAGFATFLANIGQLPVEGGEGGFDQLLAAAPVAVAPAAHTAVAIKIDPALGANSPAPQAETPAEADVAVETPVIKAEPAKADPAALATNLLIALNGNIAGAAPAPGKPVTAKPEADAASPETLETGETVATAPATNWAAIVAAVVPAATKPAKPAEAAAAPADAGAPALPVAPRPRDAAAAAVLPGIDAPIAKPIEAAPSMTILFAQPAAQGAATLAQAAAPAVIAERVLDMDSDGAWIDQLAHDIAATKSDSGDISFRLMPKHLGRLDVAMQMGDEGVSLKMDTHHEATATIVTVAQGRLVDELRQQGVRVAGAEVTCTPGETGRQSQSHSQGHGRATTHLIETATERAEPRDEERAADRRGRFA